MSYQPLIALALPGTNCTVLGDKLRFKGWFLAESERVAEKAGEVVEVLLEEYSAESSPLRSGMALASRIVVANQVVSGSPRLEEIKYFPVTKTFQNIDPRLTGVFVEIEGTIDVSDCAPRNGSSPRHFVMHLAFRHGAEAVAVSNPGVFSVPGLAERVKPYGGFSESPLELHSDYLFVTGWAINAGDRIEKVDVIVDGVAIGQAEVNLPSPEQEQFLAGFSEVGHCGFAKWVSFSELSNSCDCRTSRSISPHLAAEVLFSSGNKLHLDWGTLRWYPAPAPTEAVLAAGELESVALALDGTIHMEGWLIEPRANGVQLVLRGARTEIALKANDHVQWRRREDVEAGYPMFAGNEQCAFSAQISQAAFGPNPGLVRVLVRDSSGAEQLLGSSHAWSMLSNFFERAHPKRSLARKLVQQVFKTSRLSAKPLRKRERLAESDAVSVFPKRLLFASHNLAQVEGAPKVLFSVIKSILNTEKSEITVVSPYDGALRNPLEQLGVRVCLLKELAMAGQSPERYWQGLRKATALFREVKPDLVYANVIDSFWAVDLAHRWEIPSIWAVHESIDPLRWYSQFSHYLRTNFVHQLTFADRLLFVSKQTERLFAGIAGARHRLVIPNAVNLAKIDERVAEGNRAEIRRRLGVSESVKMVTIVGTTTERKGQDVFLREMALLKAREPQQQFRFFIVGAREIPFLNELRKLVAELDLSADVELVPEQPEVSCYFIASDVLVIASREESAPLVSLEAFAYRVPLVSTDVFGLADQIEDERNALVFDLNVEGSLAQQIVRLLADEKLQETLKAGGRETVEQRFSYEKTMEIYRKEISRLYQEYRK